MRKLAMALLAATLAPCLAAAQQPGKVYRVASLGTVCKAGPLDAARGTPWEGLPLLPFELTLLQSLRDAGPIDGRNVAYDRRCWETEAQLQAAAADLATRNLDAAITWSVHTTRVLKQALRAPIVFIGLGDPVAEGLVESLARPGGNVTGVSSQTDELLEKRAQIARELLPDGKTVSVLYLRADEHIVFPAHMKRPTPSERLGFELLRTPVEGWSEIEATLLAMQRHRPDLLLIGSTARMFDHAARLFPLATSRKIPTSCAFAMWVERGCLMSYSASYSEQAKQAGRMLGKILLGADPAEMPVEQGITFEFVINLKTAREIGLEIPPSILLRVDRVIE